MFSAISYGNTSQWKPVTGDQKIQRNTQVEGECFYGLGYPKQPSLRDTLGVYFFEKLNQLLSWRLWIRLEKAKQFGGRADSNLGR